MLFAQAPTTCCIGASFTTEPGWTTCYTNGTGSGDELGLRRPQTDYVLAAF